MNLIACLKDIILRRRVTAAQFAKFFIIGGINTVVDFGIYVALTRLSGFWGRHIIWAACVSFTVAVFSSYLMNSFWTFKQRQLDLQRSLKFFVVATGGLAWTALIIYLLTTAGLYDIFAKIIATGLVLIWNFTLQKKWTFRC